jgi:hypothetical protein
MKSNILSNRQLLERGYTIHMEDKYLALRDAKRQLVAKVSMSKNRIFSICGDMSISKRFGHLNFDGLQLFRKASMVHGLPKIEKTDHVYEVFTLGKQHRLSFSKGQS